MRFIHTADLHLGKRLNDVPLIEDQVYILGEIRRIAREERVVGEGGKNRLGTVFAARGGGGELAASTADEDVPKPFGTELDVAGLFEDPPDQNRPH